MRETWPRPRLPNHLAAHLIGPTAVRALRAGARGEVRAVFQRSFYVCLDSGWVAVGPTQLGAGPLTLLCQAWPSHSALGALLRCGDAARVDNSALYAGVLSFATASATPWWPEPLEAWTAASLGQGLAVASAVLGRLAPDTGLDRPPPGRGAGGLPTFSVAAAPLAYLAHVLEQGRAQRAAIDADAIAPLVGLGPGLTPSGDDYLGGILVALAVLGQTDLRDRLWRALRPLLAHRTVDISRAHLQAAAEGFGSEALHRALSAILTGASDRIAAAIAALAALGHSSGFAALAGGLSVLRGTLAGASAPHLLWHRQRPG